MRGINIHVPVGISSLLATCIVESPPLNNLQQKYAQAKKARTM